MAKCKVTIMNDTSLFDGHGFVQTWCKEEKEKINSGGHGDFACVTVFSFTHMALERRKSMPGTCVPGT